jgi:hypothetical protein
MELNFFTSLLTNATLRWLFWLTVTIFNFYAFIQDPIRFSNNSTFFGIPNKWFIYVARMLTFALDIITFLGLWFTIPFATNIPFYWFIPFIIVGYAIISQYTIDSPTYSNKDDTFSPPPDYLWSLKSRVILFAAILVLNVVIFTQFYIASGIKDLYDNTVLHRFILQRFGGFYSGNYLAFFAAWFGVTSFIFDYEMLECQYYFKACEYNLPNSWNF